MHRVHVIVEGRVQGVGFRWFASRQARSLALRGVARNRPDGSVEIEAEGEREALTRFVAAMREGPSAAEVTRCDATWSEGPARHDQFTVGR